MCLTEDLTNYPCRDNFLMLINSNITPSNQINDIILEAEEGLRSKWNYLWIFPLNLGASLIGIAFGPVACIVDLLAGCLFKLLAICSSDEAFKENFNQSFKNTITLGIAQVTDFPRILLARIFCPFDNFQDAYITSALSECMDNNSYD
jgi:hypothetical protein